MITLKQIRKWLFGTPIETPQEAERWIRRVEYQTGVAMPYELRQSFVQRYEKASEPLPFEELS